MRARQIEEEARQLEREIAAVRVSSLPALVRDGVLLMSHELEALREAARLARISRIHGPNRLFLVDLV